MDHETCIQLAQEGLQTDGEHHKQWFLSSILFQLLGEEEYTQTIEALGLADDEGTPP